jgi:hypothetical protein
MDSPMLISARFLWVATQAVATVGSEVLVEGTVHADKDFGSGTKLSAIVEHAKVQ